MNSKNIKTDTKINAQHLVVKEGSEGVIAQRGSVVASPSGLNPLNSPIPESQKVPDSRKD